MLPLKLHYRQQNKTHTQNYLELSQTVDELYRQEIVGGTFYRRALYMNYVKIYEIYESR